MKNYQNFYFVGIGGIGMSALARYFHAAGKNVLGYDKTETKLTTELQKEGISITFEDVVDEKISSLKKEETLVIYTPAIKVLRILDYFNENGVMKTGWLQDGDKWYYLTDEIKVNPKSIDVYHGLGAMKIGWFKDNDNQYLK